MKSSFQTIARVLAFGVVCSSLTGCGKLKSLIARRPGHPTPSPAVVLDADGNSAPAPAGPAKDGAAVAVATPTRPLAPAINKNAAVIILCYHRLEEHPRPKDQLAITPAEFEKEMQTVKDSGFTVIKMQDFLAWRRGDKDIPAKSAVITIDDGFVSGYDTAWPILKKFGYPFTLFVYINYINSGGKSLSWDQLAEMRDAGVDIESHTYSHANLHNPNDHLAVDKHTFDLIQADVKNLGPDGWLKKEIIESKAVLEKQLGIKVNAIAYPFGKYNQQVRDVVKAAGYEAAFTVYGQRISHSMPAYDLLGRYAVDQTNPKVFQEAMTMVGGGMGGVPPVPEVAQLAAASMITQPMEGETINNPKPLIKANLATMGDVDPKAVEMRISGLGLVPSKYDAATKTVSFQIVQPLTDKTTYNVILTASVAGKRAETRWSFTFDSKAPPAPKTR